jgi:uncharacterized protein YbjT (DUF2867 family)
MKVLVVGATGGSGRAAVETLAGRGHEVTAFARRASAVFGGRAGVRAVDGDATCRRTSGAPSVGRTRSW